jgi:hypothetical protein
MNNQPNSSEPRPSNDPSTINYEEHFKRLEHIVHNMWQTRHELFGRLFGRHDSIDGINAECGYPDVIAANFFRELFDRNAIAERVCTLMPKETWQVTPRVFEDEDSKTATPFEAAWDKLGAQIAATGGARSYYKDEEGSLIWPYLLRADILSGIGTFGLILLGLNDGKMLDMPADGVPPDGNPKDITGVTTQPTEKDTNVDIYGGQLPAQQLSAVSGTDAQYFNTFWAPMMPNGPGSRRGKKGKGRTILFMRVFDESLVQVVQYEASIRSPRFGQPVMYLIHINDPRQPHTGVGLPLATVRVHWSRVIHLADNLTSSEVFGVPRQRPVFNHLLDLRKIYGADGEGYWKSCFAGLSIETHPQLGGDVPVNLPALKEMIGNYFAGLDRALNLVGMTAKTLAPQVIDPTPHIAIHLEAICIHLGCPIRVFKGSERGELASSQDDAAWNDRLKHRQNTYVTPRIICPFIDRLIALGILPIPDGFTTNVDSNHLIVSDDRDDERTQAQDRAEQQDGDSYSDPDSKSSDKDKDEDDEEDDSAGYSVEWPDLDSNTDKDKSAIALQSTQAITTFVQSGGEQLLTPFDFLVRVLGWDEEEAKAAIDAAKKEQEDQQQEQQDLASEHGLVPQVPGFEQKAQPPQVMGQGEAPGQQAQVKGQQGSQPGQKAPNLAKQEAKADDTEPAI